MRNSAIKRLEKVASEWALEQAIAKGANQDEERARIQVETVIFGSYMLKVHSPGTDVDVILVFRSKYVSQKEFQTSFVRYLQN